jgi:hypothetical protein
MAPRPANRVDSRGPRVRLAFAIIPARANFATGLLWIRNGCVRFKASLSESPAFPRCSGSFGVSIGKPGINEALTLVP